MNEIDIWQKLYPNMPFDKDYRKNKNYVSLGKPGKGWMVRILRLRMTTKEQFKEILAEMRDSGKAYDIIILVDPIKGSLKFSNMYFRGQKIKIQLTADFKNSKFPPGTYTFYRKWHHGFPRQYIQITNRSGNKALNKVIDCQLAEAKELGTEIIIIDPVKDYEELAQQDLSGQFTPAEGKQSPLSTKERQL